MEIQALGYMGVGASNVDEWSDFATRWLGMQMVERGNTGRAFRMDDRKQRLVIDRTLADGDRYFGWEVADAEAQYVVIEAEQIVDVLHMEHRVPHAQRPGTEPGNRPSRLERVGGDISAMKRLQPVAARIGEADQFANEALIGKRRWLPPHRDAGLLQPCRERL